MIARREEFRREVKKLFNSASQDIEKKLGTDRIRKNLNVVEEDLKLYKDQKTERKITYSWSSGQKLSHQDSGPRQPPLQAFHGPQEGVRVSGHEG